MDANAFKNTHRLQFRFWLDVMREDENDLAEYVEDLKIKRSFAKTIRDALHLIRDLRAGKIDWLLFLFPWVYQAIYTQVEADILARQQPASEPQDLIMAQLARLEAKMEAIGAVPVGEGERPSQVPIPKALPPSTFRYSDDDEIDLDIQQAVSDGSNNPTFNMAITMASMTGDFQNLNDEILEYGIRTGRIPSRYKREKPVIQTTSIGRPRQIELPQFTEPVFDDDEPVDLFS